MIITHIICNFSIYSRERDGTEVRVLEHMLLGPVLQVVILTWMVGFVNLFLPSCPVCDQLQTFTEWLPGGEHWFGFRTELI